MLSWKTLSEKEWNPYFPRHLRHTPYKAHYVEHMMLSRLSLAQGQGGVE